MKKNVGISISKCLKSAAKNRRANQTARAILSAPTVFVQICLQSPLLISGYLRKQSASSIWLVIPAQCHQV